MIRPLRQRHRRIVVVVGIVVALLLIAALWNRRPIPTVASPILGVAGEKTELPTTTKDRPR